MAAGPRYDFYEKVLVDSRDSNTAGINGRLGAVLGRACGEDGRWSYAIWIYDKGVCWSCCEDDLRSTGEFDRRDSFFDGTSIRVSRRGELLG
jgi:hypothetical protein